MIFAVAGGGCATTVRPAAQPIDPVAVFLTNYGVHSSLMLPTPDGRFVEYSFGDYGYAALNRGGPHNALGALFVSGQSGIGRRFLTVVPGEETPRPAWRPKNVQKIYANRFEVYALVKQLDQRFRAGATGNDEPVLNEITDTTFVKDTERYSIANNCNHMTARMLRQLGCEVKGNTAASAFKVVGTQQLPPTIDIGRMAQAPVAPAAQVTTPVVKRPTTTDERAGARPASYTKLDLE
jgi:hypothetical protein